MFKYYFGVREGVRSVDIGGQEVVPSKPVSLFYSRMWEMMT
jgi:hypothetical protein